MRDPKAASLVKEGVRTAALHRLFGPGYELPQISQASQSIEDADDTWLVKIIVSSEPIRIQFKVYYTVELAKAFYQSKHPNSKDLAVRIYHDFIREFCNLTAGAIKVWLADLVTVMKTDDLVVNLPDQKPAVVEMPPFNKADTDDVLYDSWTFVASGKKLLCVSEVQVFDWKQVADIQPNLVVQDEAAEEIEFL